MNIYTFPTSGAAYDATQCGAIFGYADGKVTETPVETGDILVIESEKVIGIADTWPVAVTLEFGQLHIPAHGVTLEQAFADRKVTAEHIAAAKALADERGWPHRD